MCFIIQNCYFGLGYLGTCGFFKRRKTFFYFKISTSTRTSTLPQIAVLYCKKHTLPIAGGYLCYFLDTRGSPLESGKISFSSLGKLLGVSNSCNCKLGQAGSTQTAKVKYRVGPTFAHQWPGWRQGVGSPFRSFSVQPTKTLQRSKPHGPDAPSPHRPHAHTPAECGALYAVAQ